MLRTPTRAVYIDRVAGSCHNSILWSPLVNLMPQYYLQQLAAAKMGSERDLRSRIHLRQELSRDHSKLAVSNSDATGAVADRWKTCVLGFFLRQMLLQTLLDLVRQLLSHLNPSMQVFPLQQHLSQMKSETASFPHASATDSINIRDCKFLAPATNLASASDSLTSETASQNQ